MPVDRIWAATVTGLTVFGERAECGCVFPAPDYPTAVENVTAAHKSGRMGELVPGKYPEMSVVVCVFEVPFPLPLLAAIAARVRAIARGDRP